jgi:hypothetical protein
MDQQMWGNVIGAIGVAIAALASFWSIFWALFTHKKEVKNTASKSASNSVQRRGVISETTLEDVKKYDPRVSNIIAAAEEQSRKERGLPLGMATGFSARVVRIACYSATVFGVLFLIVNARYGAVQVSPTKEIRSVLGLAFLFSFAVFVCDVLLGALPCLILFPIMALYKEKRKLKTLHKERRFLQMTARCIGMPFMLLLYLLVGQFQYLKLYAAFLRGDSEEELGLKLDAVLEQAFPALQSDHKEESESHKGTIR